MRELDAANKQPQSILRQFLMGHLKFRADPAPTVKIGHSGPDSFLQLASCMPHEKFSHWYLEVVGVIHQRQ
jgi:hypothetical protein